MDVGLSGQFSPNSYIQLLRAIRSADLSGVLEIHSGRMARQIQFVEGQIVGYQSNMPDDALIQTVEEAFGINARTLRLHVQQLDAETSLAESLVQAEILTGAELRAHMGYRIRRGLGALMGLKTGDWRFQGMAWLNRGVLSEQLAPEIDPFEALWEGLTEKITDVELMQLVPVEPTQSFKLLPEGLELLKGCRITDKLRKTLESGDTTDLEKLVSIDPSNPTQILKLVWLMYHYGVLDCASDYRSLMAELQREKPLQRQKNKVAAEDVHVETQERTSERLRRLRKKRGKKSRDESKIPETETAKPSLSEWIQQEFEQRMGCNYYVFAAVNENESYSQIDKRIKRQLIKWVKAGKSSELTGEAAEKCTSLIRVMKEVHKVLTNPERRTVYDQQLRASTAPLAGERSENDPSEEGPAEVRSDIPDFVQGLMDAGRFTDALPALKKLRFDNPSSIDVLTSLGWAIWNAERNASEAREWLQMALTFDGERADAVEYLCRIAIETGEHDHAQRYLRRFLQLEPTSKWAQDRLDELSESSS